MRTSTPLVILVTVALLVSACAGGSLPGIDDPTGSGAAGADDLPVCPEHDEPRDYDPPPSAQPPPDPRPSVGERDPEQPVSDVEEDEDAAARATTDDPGEVTGAARAWAEQEAADHFAGLWLDDDHGAMVIAFTDDVDAYADEVRDRFGGGWWVVRAERSLAELHDLTRAVADTTAASGAVASGRPGSVVSWGPREDRGVVAVDVVGGDDHALAQLAAQLDDPAYCFTVIEPPAQPDGEGPVRTLATVAGWRDGLEVESGALLEIADDEAAAQRLIDDNVPDDLGAGPEGEPWEDGRHGDLADVDLDTQVVAVYSSGRSGSCPEWVAEVRTSDDGVVVDTEVPSRGPCTDDFNFYRTVIAIDRDRVPSAEELPAALDRGYDVVEGAVVVYPASDR